MQGLEEEEKCRTFHFHVIFDGKRDGKVKKKKKEAWVGRAFSESQAEQGKQWAPFGRPVALDSMGPFFCWCICQWSSKLVRAELPVCHWSAADLSISN